MRLSSYTFLLLLVMMTSIASCHRKTIEPAKEGILNKYISLEKNNCYEVVGAGIDSKVGKIICGNDTLAYDLGRYSPRGPKSTLDNFIKTFKTYHYSNFFRLLGFQEKFAANYRDKVKILNVKSSYENKEYLVNCNTCNRVAEINFQGKTFYYPYLEEEKLIINDVNHMIEHYSTSDHSYKIYFDNNYKLYSTMSDTLSISITCYTCPNAELLKGVRWINDI